MRAQRLHGEGGRMRKLFALIKNPFEGQAHTLLAANRILLHGIIAGAICTAVVVIL